MTPNHPVTQQVTLNSRRNTADIVTNVASITAIELKTDFISVTQAVNLDTMESDIAGFALGTVVTKTADYTATSDDDIIMVDTGAGAVVITLPAPVSGKHYTIKVIEASATTTVGTLTTQLIDGAATVVLSTLYDWIHVVSDGVNWFIISSQVGV